MQKLLNLPHIFFLPFPEEIRIFEAQNCIILNRRFVPIFLLSWLFAQCAREVTIDLPEEEPKAVAICHFTTGQPFKVRVTLSQPIYDATEPKVPETAEVIIMQEGVPLDKLFRKTGDNGQVYWESNVLAKAQVPYSITVRADEVPEAQASSSVPAFYPIEAFRIDSQDVTTTPLNDGQVLMNIPLKLYLENLPADKRYFAFYLKHDLDVGEWVNGEWVTDFTYEGLHTNFSADGRTLSLLHDLEAEPLVLVNENFWSDNRDSLIINARITYYDEVERPRRLYVEWHTLSEDFYKYHLSLDRQGGNLPLSDPDALYNNVTGGYGNFSGYSVKVDTIDLPF